MEDGELRALEAFSRDAMTAIDRRRRLGDATCGDVLRLQADRGLPRPGRRLRDARRSSRAPLHVPRQ